MRHALLIGTVLLLFSAAVLLLSSGCAAIPQALPAGTSVWAQTGKSVAVTPVSPAADAVAETTSSAQAALPAGWRSYTVTAGGYTFACPEDWEVRLPPAAALSSGPGHATVLTAPAASYPGGNGFAIVYNSYAIAPGQTLSDWYQQAFLASQDGMIVPRGTQAVEALPMTLPGVRGLLVTELMGSNPFWQRHKVYLTHDEIVLELLSETTAEHSASTVQTLRELAATVRFLPDAPRLLTDIFAHPHAPQLAEVVAAATAQAVIAQTPECDLTCRDATAWATVFAGITPGPTLTYAPAMATDEARYIEMLTTATAAALTTTPTPPPSATPAPTPRPSSQVGEVLYEGERLDPAGQVQTRFAVAYAPDEWALTGDYQLSTLTHRQLPHCALELQPGGWGVGGPAVSDRVSFAGLTWRTTHWIVAGWMTYWPEREGLDLWFGLRVDQQATTAEVQACRAAAEAVLQTLSFTVPRNTPDQATPGPCSVVGNWGGDTDRFHQRPGWRRGLGHQLGFHVSVARPDADLEHQIDQVAHSVVFRQAMNPATDVIPPGWQLYRNVTLGVSFAHPADWEPCHDTGQSRLFCRIVSSPEAAPLAPPTLWVTLQPSGFTNEHATAYNFWSETEIEAALSTPVGQSVEVLHAPEGYRTYTRLADVEISGLPGAVVENQRVWEAGPNVKERRVLVPSRISQ